MDDFLKSFGSYYRNTQFDTISFWAFPVVSILLIWLITLVSLKFLTKRKKLKTVFIINRVWIASSLIVAGIIIGLICFWWTKNYFSDNPLQLSLLISLFISILIAIISLFKLRGYYTAGGIKEITDQPKTPSQLDATITFLKRAFRKNKFFFLIPFAGFIMLLFSLSQQSNLISIVVDNTASWNFEEAKGALNATLEKLDQNNKVVITSFNDRVYGKQTFDDIIKTKNYSPTCDVSANFASPAEAIRFVSSLKKSDGLSPITEVIWQNYLFAKETFVNNSFKNKLLLIITDGDERFGKSANPTAENELTSTVVQGKFLCNSEEFTNYFISENVYLIDYTGQENNLFMQNARSCGYDIQNGSTKDDYSFALQQILTNFQNNWYLIYWTIVILVIMTIIGLLINPKKIA